MFKCHFRCQAWHLYCCCSFYSPSKRRLAQGGSLTAVFSVALQVYLTICHRSSSKSCLPSTKLITSSMETTHACCQTVRTRMRTPRNWEGSKWCVHWVEFFTVNCFNAFRASTPAYLCMVRCNFDQAHLVSELYFYKPITHNVMGISKGAQISLSTFYVAAVRR